MMPMIFACIRHAPDIIYLYSNIQSQLIWEFSPLFLILLQRRQMDQSPAAAFQRLDFNKRTLISAVSSGDTETVVDLLDGGIPIDTKDDEGMSLLHLEPLFCMLQQNVVI